MNRRIARRNICSSSMQRLDPPKAEPAEVEYMDLVDEVDAPKMIQPKKPKKKEMRLPGVKLLRRINKDREDENLRRREEQLNKREAEFNRREAMREADELAQTTHDNNVTPFTETNEPENIEEFVTKLRRMRLR